MILKWILDAISNVIGTFLEAWDAIPAPQWAKDAGATFGNAINQADGLGTWLPINFMLVVAAVVLGARLLAYTIKAVRIVASFLTAGGGSSG